MRTFQPNRPNWRKPRFDSSSVGEWRAIKTGSICRRRQGLGRSFQPHGAGQQGADQRDFIVEEGDPLRPVRGDPEVGLALQAVAHVEAPITDSHGRVAGLGAGEHETINGVEPCDLFGLEAERRAGQEVAGRGRSRWPSPTAPNGGLRGSPSAAAPARGRRRSGGLRRRWAPAPWVRVRCATKSSDPALYHDLARAVVRQIERIAAAEWFRAALQGCSTGPLASMNVSDR